MNLSFENTTTSPMRNLTLSETPKLDTYAEYRASIVIWKFVPPILLVLGTAGNILSILVLTRKAMRTSTTALYLTVLAFSDLIVLYTGLLRQWMAYSFGIDLRTFSEIGCKIHVWLVYSFTDFSSWILILVTLERVIAVWLPHRLKHICTQCSALVGVVSVGVFLLLLNSHLLYGYGFVYNGGNVLCNAGGHDYSLFFYTTWTWMDLCAFCAIPFFMIVVGNTLILTKIIRSRNNARSRVSVTSGNRSVSGKHSYMTALLFTLNGFFLISTTPASVYNIGYPYWSASNNVETKARLDLWWAIVNMPMYCNNVFNFMLYCLTGTKFRQEVIRIFCQRKHGTNTTSIQLSNLRSSTDDDCNVTLQQTSHYRFLPK